MTSRREDNGAFYLSHNRPIYLAAIETREKQQSVCGIFPMFQFGTGDIAAISITPVTQSFQGCFRFPNTIPAGAGRLCVIKKNIIFSNYQSIYPRITWRFKLRHAENFQ
ncbi:MAG: hypothetical protein MUD09_02765 [Desulfobacterales bacterium]|nr:hypothetical protein [Desulfobacterales bacterium]